MIRIIIMQIIYVVLFAWMSFYRSKTNNNVSKNAKAYSVTLPKILMKVYTVCFVFGIFLAIVFSYLC